MDTESVFTSRVFKFVIGTEKREFHVQEKLIVPHSNALMRMFNNGMKESQQGLVVIDDVEPSTFSSFLSFVIYNDYNVTGPEPNGKQQVEDDANQSLLKDCESLQDRYYPHSSRPNLIRKVPNLMYIALLVRSGDRGRCYGPPAGSPDSGLIGFDVIRDFKSANRNFYTVCSHHIKLYIFADKWDIPNLKRLCLHKLHRCLVMVKLSSTGYNYLFDLTALAYLNTTPGDNLRKLFTQMCVADISTVRSAPGFSHLANRFPEVAVDIIVEEPKYDRGRVEALSDIKSKFRVPS